jgi:hypothetical protein
LRSFGSTPFLQTTFGGIYDDAVYLGKDESLPVTSEGKDGELLLRFPIGGDENVQVIVAVAENPNGNPASPHPHRFLL